MVNAPHDPEESRPQATQVGEVLGVGLQFAGAILLFLFLGRWLDQRFGTEPWLLLVGVLVGAVGGFASLYRQLVVVPRQREQQRKAKQPKG